MPSIRSRIRSLPLPATREALELEIGRLQHQALSWTLIRTGGLRPGVAHIPGPDGGMGDGDGASVLRMPYLARGLVSGPDGGVHAAARPGAPPPVLLIHGFGGNKETWLLLIASMARRRPVVTVDLPGFGQASRIPGSAATPAAQARALVAFLDALALPRVDVVATSMGGGIALRLAHDLTQAEPGRIRSLVLINSVGPLVAKSEFAQALERGQNDLVPQDAAAAERMITLATARQPRLPRTLMRYAVHQRVAARAELGALFDAWACCPPEHGLPCDYAAIDVPALILCGQRDRIVHPSTSHALAAAMPRAQLTELEHIGHAPQLEAPWRTARIIERFLDERSAGREAARAAR